MLEPVASALVNRMRLTRNTCRSILIVSIGGRSEIADEPLGGQPGNFSQGTSFFKQMCRTANDREFFAGGTLQLTERGPVQFNHGVIQTADY